MRTCIARVNTQMATQPVVAAQYPWPPSSISGTCRPVTYSSMLSTRPARQKPMCPSEISESASLSETSEARSSRTSLRVARPLSASPAAFIRPSLMSRRAVKMSSPSSSVPTGTLSGSGGGGGGASTPESYSFFFKFQNSQLLEATVAFRRPTSSRPRVFSSSMRMCCSCSRWWPLVPWASLFTLLISCRSWSTWRRASTACCCAVWSLPSASSLRCFSTPYSCLSCSTSRLA
mmetsp:Transcript_27088/g.74483  ORF Transcript_27088/g.74483 Transcript_27088/m.74483 type:complete len:233 (+) Transcript_27088:338-1036(+)